MSSAVSDAESFREREIMLGSYTTTTEPSCEKKRFPDITPNTKFSTIVYGLVDTKCLFQKDGNFGAKETITMREATMTIMDYYEIDPAAGTSHFLDIDIDDTLQ
jgi:hypothetical protein